MPNDQRIRDIVREEMQRADTASRFHVNPIAQHIHNNIDAPFVFTPSVTFVGLVFDDTTTGSPFPKGWSVTTLGTGVYRVTHRLNSLLYGVSITPAGNPITPTTWVGFQILEDVNSFDVLFFDTNTQTNVDNTFYFQLTFVANRTNIPPTYT